MPALYFNNNGVTCCTPLRATQPSSGHYLGISVANTPYYLQLNASSSHPMKVNIGGTQYAPVVYPENTDILITPTFICKRTATTEALCFYANGNLILNSAGTACCAINIPDDAVITICGPANAVYVTESLSDSYYAANVTRSCACISMSADAITNIYETNSCACIYGEYDWEQSIDDQTWVASCPVNQYFTVGGANLTGTHTISATVTSCIQNLSCTTTCSFTLPSGTHLYCCLTPMATGSLTGDAKVCLPFCSSFKLDGTDIGNSGHGCMSQNGSHTSFNGYCDIPITYRYDVSAAAYCCFGTYSFTRVEV